MRISMLPRVAVSVSRPGVFNPVSESTVRARRPVNYGHGSKDYPGRKTGRDGRFATPRSEEQVSKFLAHSGMMVALYQAAGRFTPARAALTFIPARRRR